jgi:hypothetical protein
MRTLPDFLSEEESTIPPRINRISHQEILTLGETLSEDSPESAIAFMENSPIVRELLSRDQFNQWVLMGRKILNEPSGASGLCTDLCAEYFQASSTVLSSGSFHHLRAWIEQGLEIAKSSLPTATHFFRLTPTFLQNCEVTHLRSWAHAVIEVLATGEKSEEAAIEYIKSSAEMLQFMPFRELKDWNAAGLHITKQSTDLASTFFSLSPEGLDCLYATERLRVCKICSFLAKTQPEKAIELYQTSPEVLLDINPNVRILVLDAASKISSKDPEGIIPIFNEIAESLMAFSYPTQESIMKSEISIGRISIEASMAYLRNVGLLLEEIHETFLPNWLEKGISVLLRDEQMGIDYFSLQSQESRQELSQWKEAILLEDHQNILSIFTHALAGKELGLKSTEELDLDDRSDARNYPTSDGTTIYLPPFAAGGETHRENFRVYKVAAAHQAGYVELGTFEAGFSSILARLGSLPVKGLAMDIFFILEDGRIDRRLKEEYRGLRQEMDLVLSRAMTKRPSLNELPLQEAIVEALLRLSVDYLDDSEIPRNISGEVDFIKGAMEGFYEKARSVWDSFSKALVIYEYVSKLPTSRAYLPYIPLIYRGRLDPDLIPGPGPWESPPDEIIDEMGVEGGVVPIPLEELQAILENIKDMSDLKFLEGEGLSSDGLFITDTEGVKAKGAQNDQDASTWEGKKPIVIATASRSIFQEGPFYYDEWDYLARAYRRKWCCLREKVVDPLESGLVDEIYANYGDLIQEVRKQFQRIRPEQLEIVRRVEWGDEIDFPAMVQGVVERKAGTSPSDKIFTRKERRIRRISTLFLVDMSASTDELVPYDGGEVRKEKKIIEIEIESLVVIMEALDALADEYAIFGFSGYGREQVDFYRIKDFADTYSESLKKRISGIQPKQGTRMGPAIRHAIGKLKPIESDQRILLLLSDGFPQDHDYGEDRRSNEYALHDTMMALLEARKEGIRPFCITVDQGGNDYLRKMCDPANYLVIQDIYSLPEILPKVVESLMA